MAKYSEKLTKKICKLIASDSYTIAEICKNVGISEAVFHLWKSEKLEFLDSIKKAEEDRYSLFASEARKSLLKKVRGYEAEEVKEIYVKDKDGKEILKERTNITKHYQPDTAAIIFTLTNRDPAKWQNNRSLNSNAADDDSSDENVKPTIKLPDGTEIEI